MQTNKVCATKSPKIKSRSIVLQTNAVLYRKHFRIVSKPSPKRWTLNIFLNFPKNIFDDILEENFRLSHLARLFSFQRWFSWEKKFSSVPVDLRNRSLVWPLACSEENCFSRGFSRSIVRPRTLNSFLWSIVLGRSFVRRCVGRRKKSECRRIVGPPWCLLYRRRRKKATKNSTTTTKTEEKRRLRLRSKTRRRRLQIENVITRLNIEETKQKKNGKYWNYY